MSSVRINKDNGGSKHRVLEGALRTADSDAPAFDSARTAKLLRKLDLNIVPFLAFLYL